MKKIFIFRKAECDENGIWYEPFAYNIGKKGEKKNFLNFTKEDFDKLFKKNLCQR